MARLGMQYNGREELKGASDDRIFWINLKVYPISRLTQSNFAPLG
jgi:hypothetical protein